MYKVFFKDRIISLGEDLPATPGVPEKQCHRFTGSSRLKELVFNFNCSEEIPDLYIYHPDMSVLVDAFRSCFINIEAGGGVVLNEKNEFLVIKRNGIWDLPKGKLEKGEGFEAAALREVEEEAGLSGMELVQLLVSTYHTYALSDQLVLKETRWFEMRIREQADPVLQEEEGITSYRWTRPGKTGFIRKNSYKSILDVLEIRELL